MRTGYIGSRIESEPFPDENASKWPLWWAPICDFVFFENPVPPEEWKQFIKISRTGSITELNREQAASLEALARSRNEEVWEAGMPIRGNDLNTTMDVSFWEAFNGVTKKLTYRLPSNGEEVSLTVRVPAGAVDGGRLRHRGYGDYGTGGGERGDLVITTAVRDEPPYYRDGADVRMDLSVSADVIVSGGSVDVRAPDGRTLRVKVSAGTKDGSTLRFEGLGAPDLRNPGCVGDLYVTLHVEKRD